MWVIHEINPTQLLAKAGFEIGMARQILFFHPRFKIQVVNDKPDAVIEYAKMFLGKSENSKIQEEEKLC